MTHKAKKLKYLDLYGLIVLHKMAEKDGYNFCSFATNSIPTAGSETHPIKNCSQLMHHDITKVVIHRKEDKITLCTKVGNIQYLKL